MDSRFKAVIGLKRNASTPNESEWIAASTIRQLHRKKRRNRLKVLSEACSPNRGLASLEDSGDLLDYMPEVQVPIEVPVKKGKTSSLPTQISQLKLLVEVGDCLGSPASKTPVGLPSIQACKRGACVEKVHHNSIASERKVKLQDNLISKFRVETPVSFKNLGPPNMRREIKEMQAWFEEMQQEHLGKAAEILDSDALIEEKEDALEQGLVIYKAGLREMVRQVAVYCSERGTLLNSLLQGYQEIWVKLLSKMKTDFTRQQNKHTAKIQHLRQAQKASEERHATEAQNHKNELHEMRRQLRDMTYENEALQLRMQRLLSNEQEMFSQFIARDQMKLSAFDSPSQNLGVKKKANINFMTNSIVFIQKKEDAEVQATVEQVQVGVQAVKKFCDAISMTVKRISKSKQTDTGEWRELFTTDQEVQAEVNRFIGETQTEDDPEVQQGIKVIEVTPIQKALLSVCTQSSLSIEKPPLKHESSSTPKYQSKDQSTSKSEFPDIILTRPETKTTESLTSSNLNEVASVNKGKEGVKSWSSETLPEIEEKVEDEEKAAIKSSEAFNIPSGGAKQFKRKTSKSITFYAGPSLTPTNSMSTRIRKALRGSQSRTYIKDKSQTNHKATFQEASTKILQEQEDAERSIGEIFDSFEKALEMETDKIANPELMDGFMSKFKQYRTTITHAMLTHSNSLFFSNSSPVPSSDSSPKLSSVVTPTSMVQDSVSLKRDLIRPSQSLGDFPSPLYNSKRGSIVGPTMVHEFSFNQRLKKQVAKPQLASKFIEILLALPHASIKKEAKLTQRLLYKAIGGLYNSILLKIKAGEKIEDIPEFFYIDMVGKFGLKQVVHRKFKEILASSIVQKENSKRVKAFARMMGLVSNRISRVTSLYYFEVMEAFFSGRTTLLNDLSEPQQFSVERVVEVITEKTLPGLLWKDIAKQVEELATLDSRRNVLFVDLDDILDILLMKSQCYEAELAEALQQLALAFSCNAHTHFNKEDFKMLLRAFAPDALSKFVQQEATEDLYPDEIEMALATEWCAENRCLHSNQIWATLKLDQDTSQDSAIYMVTSFSNQLNNGIPVANPRVLRLFEDFVMNVEKYSTLGSLAVLQSVKVELNLA